MTDEHPSTDRHHNPTNLAEVEAVRAVVHDYIDGWRCGDAHRLERSLHDDLVKRTLGDEAASEALSRVTKAQMVRPLGARVCRDRRASRRRRDRFGPCRD